MTLRAWVLVCAAWSVWGVPAMAAAQGDVIVLEDVAVRAGVTTDVAVTVFEPEGPPCEGRTVLAVPGFAHTAATFEPLAEAMFDASPSGQYACRVLAVDLPGHGESALPEGLTFGDLTLQDYAATLVSVLDRLADEPGGPDTVLAHSQGALVVQLAQQQLVDAGSSLREAFKVRNAVLLAPVPPAQVPWAFADSGVAVGVLQNFVTFDPALGLHAAIPDFVWPVIFFSDLSGALAPAAPSGAQVAAAGYNAPEPLLGALQLVGVVPGGRLGVDAGLFGRRAETMLFVVGFEQDQIVSAAEAAAVYAYLTGDASGAGTVTIEGDATVHDIYVSNPEALLDALRGTAARVR